jgi:hypothetical protein
MTINLFIKSFKIVQYAFTIHCSFALCWYCKLRATARWQRISMATCLHNNVSLYVDTACYVPPPDCNVYPWQRASMVQVYVAEMVNTLHCFIAKFNFCHRSSVDGYCKTVESLDRIWVDRRFHYLPFLPVLSNLYRRLSSCLYFLDSPHKSTFVNIWTFPSRKLTLIDFEILSFHLVTISIRGAMEVSTLQDYQRKGGPIQILSDNGVTKQLTEYAQTLQIYMCVRWERLCLVIVTLFQFLRRFYLENYLPNVVVWHEGSIVNKTGAWQQLFYSTFTGFRNYIKIVTNKDTMLVPVNALLSHYLYYSLNC